jgi:hypothetical protein
MMRGMHRWLAVLALAAALLLPGLAVIEDCAASCSDDGAGEACALRCCRVPTPLIPSAWTGAPGADSFPLQDDSFAQRLSTDPRDILHVPKRIAL